MKGRKRKKERVDWIFVSAESRPVGVEGAVGSGPLGRTRDILQVDWATLQREIQVEDRGSN